MHNNDMATPPTVHDGPARPHIEPDHELERIVEAHARRGRCSRPSWVPAEHYDRLGPWLPAAAANRRRVVGIVVHGYRKPVALASEPGTHWRSRDAVRARVAIERTDGLALLALTELAGDTLAQRLRHDGKIRWVVCLIRGDLARPIPGAFGTSVAEALSRVSARSYQ